MPLWTVEIHTALKSYTIWAARRLFFEQQTGSIEVGKAAEIAVWDQNMYRIPCAELKDLKCELTLRAGKIVYRAR